MKFIDWILKETKFSKAPTDHDLDAEIGYLAWILKSTYPLFYKIIKIKIFRFFKYRFFSIRYWVQFFLRLIVILSLIAIGAGSVYYLVVLAKTQIVKTPDPPKIVYRYDLKPFDDLIKDVGMKEAGDNWRAQRPGSQYIGWFQFGNSAFEACKVKGLNIDLYGRDRFLENKHAQITWFCELILINKEYLKNEIARWNMKKHPAIEGTITESGILMAAHLVGASPVKKFLANGGYLTADMYDGNNVPLTRYLELYSGYDVDKIIYTNIP